MRTNTGFAFLILALLALIFTLSFGLLAAGQYILPEFLKEILPFNKMRPLHVSSAISWIVLAAIGSIYVFLSSNNIKYRNDILPQWHLWIFFGTGVAIYISYLSGIMSGREYLAFTSWFIIPILVGWLLFGMYYFKDLKRQVGQWPVYRWMWGTGIIFMIYHLCEAHFWLLPELRTQVIKDMAVQWKSYGSFVGSWNMLVYGTSIYLMSKIKKDGKLAHSKTVFFFYFLGLCNLMFGWAHHTYLLPTIPWIRYVAYGISMTEWIVLGHIIYSWSRSISNKEKLQSSAAYYWLMTADFWVFLNLILALLFSIPVINYYTHGTHITVAHAMGTTIGINTSILMASLHFIAQRYCKHVFGKVNIKRVLWMFNASLLLFWISLLGAGIKRSVWRYSDATPFSNLHDQLYWVYMLFFIFGVILAISLIIPAIKLLKIYINYLNASKSFREIN